VFLRKLNSLLKRQLKFFEQLGAQPPMSEQYLGFFLLKEKNYQLTIYILVIYDRNLVCLVGNSSSRSLNKVITYFSNKSPCCFMKIN